MADDFIVRVERTMKGHWRCSLRSGEIVNAFQSDRADRNTIDILSKAGYEEIVAMGAGEQQEWATHPIEVEIRKKGEWNELVSAKPRPEGACQDSRWTPNLAIYKENARRQAITWLTKNVLADRTVVLDTETTGVHAGANIVQVALFKFPTSEVIMDTLVRPPRVGDMLRIGSNGLTAAQITGIEPEDLDDAPTFLDIYPGLYTSIVGRAIIGYNVRFDVDIIARECSNNGVNIPLPLALWDVADIACHYFGNWNAEKQRFDFLKQTDVAARLGIETPEAHTAKGDVQTLVQIVGAIANGQPERF